MENYNISSLHATLRDAIEYNFQECGRAISGTTGSQSLNIFVRLSKTGLVEIHNKTLDSFYDCGIRKTEEGLELSVSCSPVELVNESKLKYSSLDSRLILGRKIKLTKDVLRVDWKLADIPGNLYDKENPAYKELFEKAIREVMRIAIIKSKNSGVVEIEEKDDSEPERYSPDPRDQ